MILDDLKKFVFSGTNLVLLFLVGVSGATQISISGAERDIRLEKSKPTPNPILLQKHAERLSTSNRVLSASLLLLFGIGGVVHGLNLTTLIQDIREARKLAKINLCVVSAEDPMEKCLLLALNEKTRQQARKLAHRMRVLHRDHPEIRKHYDEIFLDLGHLPRVDDLVDLFRYYAYQYIVFGSGGYHGQGQPRVSELEWMQTTHALMKMGARTGLLFSFVKNSPDEPFGQRFEPNAAPQMFALRQQTEQHLETLRKQFKERERVEQQMALTREFLTGEELAEKSDLNTKAGLEESLRQFQIQKDGILRDIVRHGEMDSTFNENLLSRFTEKAENWMAYIDLLRESQAVTYGENAPSQKTTPIAALPPAAKSKPFQIPFQVPFNKRDENPEPCCQHPLDTSNTDFFTQPPEETENP